LQGFLFPPALELYPARFPLTSNSFIEKVYAAIPGICSSFFLIGGRSMHHRRIIKGNIFNEKPIEN
jgi:hypothetical protein